MESKEKLIFTMKSGPVVELTPQKALCHQGNTVSGLTLSKKKILHDAGETERAL